MRNQTDWAKRILMWGLILVALGAVVAIAGLMLPGVIVRPAYLGRLILAIGIVLLGLGIVSLLQYTHVRGDPKAGRQMMINERDERMQSIRCKAGYRAYLISSGLAFFVLIWSSFAGDVGLPTLSGDALWFSLVAVVVIPYLVFVADIAYEQKFN